MAESTPLAPPTEQPRQKKRRWWFQPKSNREKCQKECRKYAAKFPDIHYLSSPELLELHRNGTPLVLVDVRTPPEQEVSMIEGSIPLDSFLISQADDDALIVTYCTVGYRSGLEARRLGLQHPQWKDRIRSLDGFVSYTHALGDALRMEERSSSTKTEFTEVEEEETKTSNKKKKKNNPPLQLIEPSTGQSTNQVHTFGWMWGCIDDQHFQATSFPIPELGARVVQVMVSATTCFMLRMKSYCLPISSEQAMRSLSS